MRALVLPGVLPEAAEARNNSVPVRQEFALGERRQPAGELPGADGAADDDDDEPAAPGHRDREPDPVLHVAPDEEGEVLLHPGQGDVLLEVHPEAHAAEARGDQLLAQGARHEAHGPGDDQRGGGLRERHARQRGALLQARAEGAQEVQRRDRPPREVVPPHHGAARDPAAEPVPDDEGADRQGDPLAPGEEEEAEGARQGTRRAEGGPSRAGQEHGALRQREQLQHLLRAEAPRAEEPAGAERVRKAEPLLRLLHVQGHHPRGRLRLHQGDALQVPHAQPRKCRSPR